MCFVGVKYRNKSSMGTEANNEPNILICAVKVSMEFILP